MNLIIFALVLMLSTPNAFSTSTASTLDAHAAGLDQHIIAVGSSALDGFTFGQFVACQQFRPSGTPARTVALHDDGNQEYRLTVHTSQADVEWHFVATPTQTVFNELVSPQKTVESQEALYLLLSFSLASCGQNGGLPPAAGQPRSP